MNPFRFLCGLALAVSVLQAAAAEKKLRVVTSFLPAYCFAAKVAGDLADVENLLPGDAGLHDYQLTPGDLRKLSSADLLIVNGLGMETFLERAFGNTAQAKSKLVTLADGLRAGLIHEDTPHHHREEAGHEHHYDPHIWLDPILAAHGVTNVLNALTRADPSNAGAYQRNAQAYIASLHALNKELAAQLDPVREVAFVTYHNAFRYFVRRYQLNLVAVVEQVPEISPSPREMSALLATIRAKQAKALFSEPGASSRLAARIARDTRIKLGVLDPLETGELTPTAYEAGMRRNARALLEALR